MDLTTLELIVSVNDIHQTSLLHYWLLLTPNALHQPISFVLVKNLFQSLIWVEAGLSVLHSH